MPNEESLKATGGEINDLGMQGLEHRVARPFAGRGSLGDNNPSLPLVYEEIEPYCRYLPVDRSEPFAGARPLPP